MKGLIIKDLCVIKKQMKSLLLVLALFIFLSIANKDATFVLFLIPFYMIMYIIRISAKLWLLAQFILVRNFFSSVKYLGCPHTLHSLCFFNLWMNQLFDVFWLFNVFNLKTRCGPVTWSNCDCSNTKNPLPKATSKC